MLPQRARDPVVRELERLRAEAAASPVDTDRAARLIRAYFDRSLARGDPRYVGYAEAVLGRFSEPLAPQLLLERALLRQYRHDFKGASEDLASALAADPGLAAAHAWRGAIFLVQANYPAAEVECVALRRLGRESLADGCLGLTLAYRGKLDDSAQRLGKALAATGDPGNRVWLLTRLAEVAAWRGQPAMAERHFREALRIGRDDVYLLAAWGDFLLDNGRAGELLQALAGWEATDSLLLRLAEAEAKLGRPGAVRLAQALEDRFAAARARGDDTHMAEEARYRLRLRGDAREALRLAVENYRQQREPRDARILLEAAAAAGERAAAQPAIDWLSSSGFEDSVIRSLAQKAAAVAPR